MTSRRVLCATMCVGFLLGWTAPAIAQGAQCSTDVNITHIQTRGPIGASQGLGPGQLAPIQVIGFTSKGQSYDITRCVTWDEPTSKAVRRIDGGPTGSLLQTGTLTHLRPNQIQAGRLEATFKNNEGKVLSAHKLVSVSPSGGFSYWGSGAPFPQFLVKAPPLPVATPPPIQPATAGGSGAGSNTGIIIGLGVLGAGAAALAFSGLDFGGGGSSSSCPANPCASVIDASCSCFPCSFFLVSCSGGGGGSDCKQCGI